jgi:hypothetical protein
MQWKDAIGILELQGRGRRSGRWSGLLEEEDALLVGRDDVEQSVAVKVGHDELRADAALVADQLRRLVRG